MEKIGIIDIGSNTIRLVLAEIKDNSAFKIIDEVKESVRLAEGLFETGNLQNCRIERAMQTLNMFKQLCMAQSTQQIIAVATAAVRNAANGPTLIQRAQTELDLTILVLSGEEEGYYDYWGTINSMDVPHGLIMDLGGASTELIWYQNRKIVQSVSLPFGSINLTRQFQLADEEIAEDEVRARLIQFLKVEYQKIPWLKNIGNIPLIGTGGTFRNIGKIDRKQKKYPLSITHNYQLGFEDIATIYSLIKDTPLKKRKKIKGLSKDRADIFLAAITAIWTLTDQYQFSNILISGHGIREGLIYKYLLGDRPVEDVLDFSIHNLITNYDLNPTHSLHVYKLALSLYQQLQNVHQINLNLERVLKTGSMLHDVGINIRYYGHQEHSFYMVLNAGLNGLSHKELFMSALLASTHRKAKPGKKSAYSGILTQEELIDIRKAGVLLRIAESFDRTMNGVIQSVSCEISNSTVLIKTHALESPELEIMDALTASDDFKKLFRRDLKIE